MFPLWFLTRPCEVGAAMTPHLSDAETGTGPDGTGGNQAVCLRRFAITYSVRVGDTVAWAATMLQGEDVKRGKVAGLQR